MINLLGQPIIRTSFYVLAMLALMAIFFTQIQPSQTSTLVDGYWHFFFIGIFAATVANATGCGGGIVFLPAFVVLGMSVEQALATSFTIQCFGMTSGSLNWLALAKSESHGPDHCWEQLPQVLAISLTASIGGLLLAQQFLQHPPFDVHYLFSIFSITIGALILYRLKNHYQADEFHSPPLTLQSKIALIMSCFIGGIITWWLSVGVGEILAIVLLTLGYNIRFAVTLAVIVSAGSVWFALPFLAVPSLAVSENLINYNVVLFAAPAAMLGGYAARYLAMAISPKRLKAGLSLWIIFSGAGYIVVQ